MACLQQFRLKSLSPCDTRSVKRRAGRFILLFVAIMWQLHVCLAQNIVVRLIDARNGHAFGGETVRLQFTVGRGVSSRQETLQATTSGEGVARFVMPELPPAKFRLWAENYFGCSDVFEFDTQEVIHNGIAPACSKRKQGVRCKCCRQTSQHPAAGEVVLLVKRITGWDKFWWRLSGKAD